MAKSENILVARLFNDLKASKISVPQFAKETGIPKDRVYKWKQQGTAPKADDEQMIIDWINANVDVNPNFRVTMTPEFLRRKRKMREGYDNNFEEKVVEEERIGYDQTKPLDPAKVFGAIERLAKTMEEMSAINREHAAANSKNASANEKHADSINHLVKIVSGNFTANVPSEVLPPLQEKGKVLRDPTEQMQGKLKSGSEKSQRKRKDISQSLDK